MILTPSTPTKHPNRYAYKTLTFCIVDGVFNTLAIHDYGASGVPTVWLLIGCFIVVIKVSLAILLTLPQTRRNAGNVVLIDVATDLWFIVFPILYALSEVPGVVSLYQTKYGDEDLDEAQRRVRGHAGVKHFNVEGENWIGRTRDKEEPTEMQSGNTSGLRCNFRMMTDLMCHPLTTLLTTPLIPGRIKQHAQGHFT